MSIGFNKTHSVVDSLPKETTVESVTVLMKKKDRTESETLP